jgi:simple sugar transport system permease protein
MTEALRTASVPAATAAEKRYVKMTAWRRIRRGSATNVAFLYALLVLGLAVTTVVAPGTLNFLTVGNLSVLSQQIPVVAIMAIGAGVLMIAGDFDLSVAGMYTLASYLLALSIGQWGLPIPVGLAIAFSAAVLVGLVNATVTHRLAVPSFIATLGMMFVLRGVVRWVSIGEATGQPDQIRLDPGEGFHALMAGHVAGPIYMQSIWLVVVAGLAAILLNRHVLGNHIFAVGGDPDAAQKTGISIARVKRIAFIFCAVLAAFAGIMQTARIDMVDPAQTLTGLELQAIAGAVIGGVYLFGGRGSVLGMVLGAALLATIENVLILIRAPGEYMPVFVGSMVILSVIINSNVGDAAANRRSSL